MSEGELSVFSTSSSSSYMSVNLMSFSVSPLPLSLAPFQNFFMPRRMHSMHKMRPIAADVARVSVCVSVTRMYCAEKNRLNRPRCRLVAVSCGPKKLCIRCGRDPPRTGATWGVVQQTEKHWESLLWCTQQKGSFISQ